MGRGCISEARGQGAGAARRNGTQRLDAIRPAATLRAGQSEGREDVREVVAKGTMHSRSRHTATVKRDCGVRASAVPPVQLASTAPPAPTQGKGTVIKWGTTGLLSWAVSQILRKC